MNHTQLTELRQKRVSIIKQAQALHDTSVQEKRSFTAEEQTKYDNLWAEQENVQATIVREERLANVQTELAEPNRDFRPDGNSSTQTRASDQDNRQAKPSNEDLEKRSLQAVSEHGLSSLRTMPKEQREAFEGLQSRAFVSFLVNGFSEMEQRERRALQLGQGTQGGFLVAPQKFVNDLIAGLDDEVFIRSLATKKRLTGAHSLGSPTRESDADDCDWTAEIQEVNDSAGPTYGMRELSPHPLTKRIKVSDVLLNRGDNPQGEVQDRLRYKFGITQEKAHLTGTGINQPLGMFTASTDGISTSRDVSTGNTASSPTFDGLIEAKFSLKGGYHGKAKWIFHRDIVKLIRKLKDSNGQYIWQASTVVGEPDRILELPYLMSEYAPNTIQASAYVGLLGVYEYYHIVDAMTLRLKRLDELFAATNQTGFQGLLESDGMPVLEEAFARVKLAA